MELPPGGEKVAKKIVNVATFFGLLAQPPMHSSNCGDSNALMHYRLDDNIGRARSAKAAADAAAMSKARSKGKKR